MKNKIDAIDISYPEKIVVLFYCTDFKKFCPDNVQTVISEIENI